MTYTGYYWMSGQYSIGWQRAAGWYSCPATEGKATPEEAEEAAKHFGKKVRVEARP